MGDEAARMVADAAIGVIGVLQAAHVDDEAWRHWGFTFFGYSSRIMDFVILTQ